MGALYDKLKDHHKRAVDAFISTCKYAEAAKAAGSKAKNLSQTGRQLLSNSEIRAAYEERRAETAEHLEITPERILKEYARLSFASSKDFYDKKGNLVPIHELSDDLAACISGVDVLEGGKKTRTLKVKRWDKVRALESLSKHLGLFERDNEQKKTDLAEILLAIDGKTKGL